MRPKARYQRVIIQTTEGGPSLTETLKIATWNINGIKARLDNLLTWLADSRPDIVCLQEIKSPDDQFPRGAVEDAGYHVETHGQKGFNGVAILSRAKPDETVRGLPGDETDEQSRFIEAVFSRPGGRRAARRLHLPAERQSRRFGEISLQACLDGASAPACAGSHGT